MKSIAFFNNKGGVGKTTTLCNIAAYYNKVLNKRTLVIDADPQCNASLYMLGEEKIANLYETSAPSVNSIVSQLERGDGFVQQNDIPIQHTSFGPDLILGDTSFSMAEDFLSREWVEAVHGGMRALKTTYVFRDLFHKLEDKYDIIFIDLGPSLGAINRVILLGCDFFIMPMSADIFSIRAIENISMTLEKWRIGLERGLKDLVEKGDEFKMSGNDSFQFKLKFLGYTTQQYISRTIDGNKRPVNAYDIIITQIPEKVNSKFSPFIINQIKDALDIGSIPNFNSLIPMSQNAHKPIFRLASADGIIGAHFKKVDEYKTLMNHMSSNINNNIEEYDRVAR